MSISHLCQPPHARVLHARVLHARMLHARVLHARPTWDTTGRLASACSVPPQGHLGNSPCLLTPLPGFGSSRERLWELPWGHLSHLSLQPSTADKVPRSSGNRAGERCPKRPAKQMALLTAGIIVHLPCHPPDVYKKTQMAGGRVGQQ